MAKKFKILQAASKLPQSAIDNYKDFRAGNRSITRSVNPELGPKKLIYLYPFGLPNDLDNHTASQMSERAFLELSNLVNSIAVFNIDETTTAPSASPNPAYTPAKAVVSIRGTKKATDPKSGITGLPYSAYNTESFVIPFGQKSSAVGYYQEIAKEIRSAVESKSNKNSVSFKPEKWSVY